MKLTLIRHGEMQGDPWCRPARPVSGCLSARGVAQASATARALSTRRWHRVFASPLGRALQTAEIVCGAAAPITILDCLEEWKPNPQLATAPSTVWEEMMRRDAERPIDMLWQTDAGEGTYAFFARVEALARIGEPESLAKAKALVEEVRKTDKDHAYQLNRALGAK